MPIVKKNEVMPIQPVVLVVYGQPGAGNTSLACTADEPLLIDCERGAQRSVSRCDTLVANRWQDVMAEYETMREYKTIIVDTAKSAIDEFLSNYAIENNYKLRTNSLKRYGQMGEDFQQFLNHLRSIGSDLIFIAHDRENAEGDIIKHSPNVTGQSKDLLIRVADQVGYISIVNNKRTISFEPSDNYVGKNVGQIPLTTIPDATDPKFPNFMGEIIRKVKESIQGRSEAQRKANEQIAEMRKELEACENDEQIKELMGKTKALPKILQMPFFREMSDSLGKKGYVFDNEKKTYVKQTKDGEAA